MSRIRILVADDDGGTREVLKTVLKKRGYQVDLARNGEEALEQALAEPPDLLLTDVMMPRMDGWMLVKRLRARGQFALMPVVFLTQLSSADDRIHGFRLGADDYIPKPFDFEELVTRVERALERRKAMEDEIRSSLGKASADREEAEETALLMRGQLSSFGFSALLGVFEQEGTTGVLEVEHPGGRVARIWVRDGHVTQAAMEGESSIRGPEVIYALLGWHDGHFSLHRTAVEDRDEMGMSSTHLLLEGARRLDEGEVDRGV